jgi:hypothetical protein
MQTLKGIVFQSQTTGYMIGWKHPKSGSQTTINSRMGDEEVGHMISTAGQRASHSREPLQPQQIFVALYFLLHLLLRLVVLVFFSAG